MFDDVDGWDIRHVRRVNWLWHDIKKPKKFKTYTLKQGDTTQELNSEEVLSWIKSLDLNFSAEANLKTFPEQKTKSVCFDDVANFLFAKGVSSNAIESLSKEIDELVRIAKWYQNYDDPSEHETVAYLAIPLLRALGWTPQKMAIEWNKIDVGLFSKLPREEKNLSVVVEAKKKGNSCLSAFSQALSYAEGKDGCDRLIVTDGLRYGIYIKGSDGFELYAYFNITNLKSEYPIYNCKGVFEALRVMTPEWTGL